MSTQLPSENLTDAQWALLVKRVSSGDDILEDGAAVRVADGDEPGSQELHFYATPLNKPEEWRFPFAESISASRRSGALIGRVWHDPRSSYVEFEPIVLAAAQALRADYESGADDNDYVAYEQAVEEAVRGKPADLEWLHLEFARLRRRVEG